MGLSIYLLVNLQVKNVSDLEVDAVDQNHVSADQPMHIVRRWRREHNFQLSRADMHLAVQFHRDISMHDDLPLQSGRQTIALGEPWGKMIMVVVVPASGSFAVMIIVAVVTPAFVATLVVAVTMAVFVGVAIVVVAIVLVAAVIMILRHSNGR